MEKELDVAFGARESRSSDPGRSEPMFAREHDEAFQDFVPKMGIADDAALPHAAASHFELWLCERHDVGSRGEAGSDRLQDLPQGDEGYIDRGERRREGKRVGRSEE